MAHEILDAEVLQYSDSNVELPPSLLNVIEDDALHRMYILDVTTLISSARLHVCRWHDCAHSSVIVSGLCEHFKKDHLEAAQKFYQEYGFLQCQWEGCGAHFNNMKLFVNHLEEDHLGCRYVKHTCLHTNSGFCFRDPRCLACTITNLMQKLTNVLTPAVVKPSTTAATRGSTKRLTTRSEKRSSVGRAARFTNLGQC